MKKSVFGNLEARVFISEIRTNICSNSPLRVRGQSIDSKRSSQRNNRREAMLSAGVESEINERSKNIRKPVLDSKLPCSWFCLS